MKTTILGAGLAGISSSYHIGHDQCKIFEKTPVHGGHAGSIDQFGFTLDYGPHVSFTKHDYVKQLFAGNICGNFSEYKVRTRNYYKGSWIEHPAQAHLWQVPSSIRTQCLEEMKAAAEREVTTPPQNYGQWLDGTYGTTFAETFPDAYTRKYWTIEPEELSVDWLGSRMPKLDISQIERGFIPDTYQDVHYISSVRYPNDRGFQAFFDPMAKDADIEYTHEVSAIDLQRKELWFSNGHRHRFARLISTLPLPEFISRCLQATPEIRDAAATLDCTQLLLVDVFVPHKQPIPGHWFYVYDEDKFSTRIHCIERLATSNAPAGWTGIQVEVYFSRYKPFPGNPQDIASKVVSELKEMGFVDLSVDYKLQWRWCPYANVIFTHQRRGALALIWEWLGTFGLLRETGDLDAGTDWSTFNPTGTLAMAGRFAQWKYFWSDDCVLRGRELGKTQPPSK